MKKEAARRKVKKVEKKLILKAEFSKLFFERRTWQETAKIRNKVRKTLEKMKKRKGYCFCP